MIRIRLALAGVATFAVWGAPVLAEDVSPPNAASAYEVCRFGSDGSGCAHFQGYLYVRRSPSASPAVSADGRAASDASLGGDRLYLHVDGDALR